MEERNVIFEVTKVGFAVNSKWSVFVDNEFIGKIDFKKNLTKKLSKGNHTVQYKVGLQKTKVLDITVADEDIIIECVWDGTVRNFHVVGGNDLSNTDTKFPSEKASIQTKETMYCSKCGKEISKESSFCNGCGQKVGENIINNVTTSSQKEFDNNTNKTAIIIRGIASIIGIIIIIAVFVSSVVEPSINGKYWFEDGSGYIEIKKDSSTPVRVYDEYNNLLGARTGVAFTDSKSFKYLDNGGLETIGTVNGKTLTLTNSMGTTKATKK